jgi:hypothetical protein
VPKADIVQLEIKDPAVLAAICLADRDCAGFNSHGWLKYDKSYTAAGISRDVTFFERVV